MPEYSKSNMTLFELITYAPTIEEVWKETGIRRLKIEGDDRQAMARGL
jgi:hypothetical protein